MARKKLDALVGNQTKAVKNKSLELKANEELIILIREEFINLPSLFPQLQEKYFKIDTEEERYKSLKESVLNVGLIDSPLVFKTDEGYKLFVGHRRQLIIKNHPDNERFKQISCISKKVSIEEAEVMFYDSNITGGRESSKLDMAGMIQRETDLYRAISKKTGRKMNVNKEIAKNIKKSKRTVERYNNLNNLIPEYKELVENNKFKFLSAAAVGQLSQEQQTELYKALGDKVTEYKEPEIQALKENVKQNKDKFNNQLKETKESNKKVEELKEKMKQLEEESQANEEINKNTENEMLKLKEKLKQEQENKDKLVKELVKKETKVIEQQTKKLEVQNKELLNKLKKLDKQVNKNKKEDEGNDKKIKVFQDFNFNFEVGKKFVIDGLESLKKAKKILISLADDNNSLELSKKYNSEIYLIIKELSKSIDVLKN